MIKLTYVMGSLLVSNGTARGQAYDYANDTHFRSKTVD